MSDQQSARDDDAKKNSSLRSDAHAAGNRIEEKLERGKNDASEAFTRAKNGAEELVDRGRDAVSDASKDLKNGIDNLKR